jgi:uncharacterized protein YwqG|tara:strand:+ start:827 stop:1060 length:234 start_codon:yes stop_codon:yes gene_type:complete
MEFENKKELKKELNEIIELACSLDEKIGDMVSIICDEIEDETIQELEYEFENSEFSNSVANYQYEFTSKLMKILEKI